MSPIVKLQGLGKATEMLILFKTNILSLGVIIIINIYFNTYITIRQYLPWNTWNESIIIHTQVKDTKIE